MLLSEVQFDALGEFTNIAAGSAVCYLSTVSEADIDISTPDFVELIGTENDVDLSGFSVGYKFSFAAFDAGYCALVIREKFDEFLKIFGCNTNADTVKRYFDRVMMSAVEPIERLMDRTISVNVDKELSDNNVVDFLTDKSRFVVSRFRIVINKDIHAEMAFVFPENVAKDIANRFIRDGIELVLV